MFIPRARPWLMFITAPDATGGDGNVDPATLSAEEFRTKFGFPKDTKTDDMTDAEKAAYWRNESKKHQSEATAKARELGRWSGLGEFDAVSGLVTNAEAQRQQSLTEHERAMQAARAEASQQAEAAARGKYLTPAIEGQVVALTRTPQESPEDALERVRGAMQFVDVTRFLDENGDLNAAQIQTFAQSIGPKDGNASGQNGDPLFGALGRMSVPPAGSSGSVGTYREQAYKRRSSKK